MEGYAILIDLGAIRIGEGMFRQLLSDVKARGTVEYIKFYNYNTRRHREFGALVKEYNIDIDATRAGKKRVRIDIRQVMDAVRIASTATNVTTFLLVCSEMDGEYLFSELKRMGKYIVMGVTSPSHLSELAHRTYLLDRSLEVRDDRENIISGAESLTSDDIAHTANTSNCGYGSLPSDTENNTSGAESLTSDDIARTANTSNCGYDSLPSDTENIISDTESLTSDDIARTANTSNCGYGSVCIEEEVAMADDIEADMLDIDRRIVEALDRHKRENLAKVFGSMRGIME